MPGAGRAVRGRPGGRGSLGPVDEELRGGHGGPTQAWLTPYASVQHLLSADMTPTSWTQWLAVLAIWGVGFNAFAILRSRRRGADRQAEAGPRGEFDELACWCIPGIFSRRN